MTTQTTPSEPTREKTGIPKNPGRRDLGLRATLVFPNREIVEKYYVPIIYTACRTCYSEQDPDEIFRRAVDGDFDPLKMQKLISSVIESGHGSTIEHVVFTFAISGVSRTLSHQLVRHRAGVAFDQQSQRYVKFKGAATMLPHSIAEGDPDLRERFEEQVDGALGLYGELVEAGIPGEDARFVFPNATRTNLVMTTNLRALIHMSGLRLCTMAQWEIRRLFQLIRHEVFAVSPVPRLVPGTEVRAPRLLRRVRQPGRALPDPAAQGPRAGGLGREGRSGQGGGPGAAGRLRAFAGSRPPLALGREVRDETPDHAREARPGDLAGGEHLLVGQRFAGVAGAGVGDERDAAHVESDPAGRDALEHGGHADGVTAETGQHPHLGRGLVGRSGQADVDPLLEADPLGRGGCVQALAQPRIPGVGQVGEARAELVGVRADQRAAAGQVDVIAHDHQRARSE